MDNLYDMSYLAITGQQAQDICEPIYEKSGASAYNKCHTQFNESTLSASAKLYVKYLNSGGTKSFEDWKSSKLTQAKDVFGQISQWWNKKNTPTSAIDIEDDTTIQNKNTKRNWIIGISAVVVVGTIIGVVIYKKNK